MSVHLCGTGLRVGHAFLVDAVGDPVNRSTTTSVTAEEYAKDKELKRCIAEGRMALVCGNGHKLLLANGPVRRAHFRHASAADLSGTEMCEWHAEWQSRFKDIEVPFLKAAATSGIPVRDRRADAVVGDRVLEFQHSIITRQEVRERTSDYALHGKKVLWVIDCNGTDADIRDLVQSGTYLVVISPFKKWRYESFIELDYIYLSRGDYVYRAKPSAIRGGMLDVPDRKTVDQFMQCLDEGWDDKELPQCTLYHNQRGAGCGKTYESIQLINEDPRFVDKTTFIYLTKMHSAKDVIFGELKDQHEKGRIGNVKFLQEKLDDIDGKQYKVEFTRGAQMCQMIVGTIDSFMYAVGDKSVRDNDYFTAIAKSVCDGKITTKPRYAKGQLLLNKQCLIIIDEAQDLGRVYIRGMAEIMRNTYIDVYVIGDKLQSIYESNNIHTFLENPDALPHTNIVRNTGANVVRRFHDPKFQDIVNSIVPFQQFNLPPITGICDRPDSCGYSHESDDKTFEVIQLPSKDTNTNAKERCMIAAERTVKIVDEEVCRHGYLPHNFMFIVPFVSKNDLAPLLQTRMQTYWIKKFADPEFREAAMQKSAYWREKATSFDREYIRYAVFHRSEEGTSINLRESEHATRILSIHASKGTGCEVVFAVGFSESALCAHTKHNGQSTGDLQYESLLHVALTRQKKKLIVVLEPFSGDVGRRVHKAAKDAACDVMMDLKIDKKVKADDLAELIRNDEDMFRRLDETIIMQAEEKCQETLTSHKKNKIMIDMGHHEVRYGLLHYNLHKNIINNEMIDKDAFQGMHYAQKLKAVGRCCVVPRKCKEYNEKLYEISRKNKDRAAKFRRDGVDQSDTKRNERMEMPVLAFAEQASKAYHDYHEALLKISRNIRNKAKQFFDSGKLAELCPLETIVLLHMMRVLDNGIYASPSIIDIYDIIASYDTCFAASIIDNECDEPDKCRCGGHHDCLCRSLFMRAPDTSDHRVSKVNTITRSITEHYDKVKQLDICYKQIREYVKDQMGETAAMKYNVDLHCRFETEDFALHTRGDVFAFTDETAMHIMLLPQFNSLNYNRVLFDALLTKYIMANSDSKDIKTAKQRFQGKRIWTCILTLDSPTPILFELDLQANEGLVIEAVKGAVQKHYQRLHSHLPLFYKECGLRHTDDMDDKTTIECMMEALTSDKTKPLVPYIKAYLQEVNNQAKILESKLEECDDPEEEAEIEGRLKLFIKSKMDTDMVAELDKHLQEAINRAFMVRRSSKKRRF